MVFLVLAEEIVHSDLVDVERSAWRFIGCVAKGFDIGYHGLRGGLKMAILALVVILCRRSLLCWFKAHRLSCFKAASEIVELVLNVQVFQFNILNRLDIGDILEVEKKPPLVEGFAEQGWPMLRLGVDGDSDHLILHGHILRSGEFLLNFYQFMLPNDQHVAQIAHSAGPGARVRDLNFLEVDIPLFQVLHQFPEEFVG